MITEEENIRISHEIGHIYLWTIEKYFRYLTEILAWILGFIICKHNKINTQGYWKIVKECLDTYKVSYFKNK